MLDAGLMFVGGTGLALAAFGLLVNALYLATFARPLPPDVRARAPYFRVAFAVMWPLSTALQIALGVIALHLYEGNSGSAWALAAWSATGLAYARAIGLVAAVTPQRVAMSIAAAGGVANAGLGLHIVTAYPLWGTVLALLLHWTA